MSVKMLIRDLLERNKENNKIALKQGDREVSYSEWYRMSLKVAESINHSVSEDAHNIAIFLPNSISYAIAYFGISFSNRVIVPVDCNVTAYELRSVLKYCEVDLLISDEEHKDFLKEALGEYDYKCSMLNIDSNKIECSYEKSCIEKTEGRIQEPKENDTAIMLHTSGTTSNPKRVMLTHLSLLSNVQSNIESLHFNENDKVLLALPMYFGYCNTAQFLTHIYLRATIVIYSGTFSPNKFCSIVEKEKITNFTAVPTMLLLLLRYKNADKYDLSSLRIVCFGGSALPEEHIKRLIERFPYVNFIHTYGQTEASPRLTALLADDMVRKCGSVGKAIPHVEVKVFDESRHEVKVHEVGEIVAKGKNIMKGYYKQEVLTAQTIMDGFLYTGDLGYTDDEGYLYIVGRKKNMFITKGINVYPEEIEEVIMQCDGVLAVYVFGEKDELLGETAAAKVVVDKSSECTVESIQKFCETRLSSYKIPRRIYFVESLEKTYNGKIKRNGDL